jgi:hypothetical protein
MAPRVEEVICL